NAEQGNRQFVPSHYNGAAFAVSIQSGKRSYPAIAGWQAKVYARDRLPHENLSWQNTRRSYLPVHNASRKSPHLLGSCQWPDAYRYSCLPTFRYLLYARQLTCRPKSIAPCL